MTDGQTDRPTDGWTHQPTDGPTDIPNYRSSLPELKKIYHVRISMKRLLMQKCVLQNIIYLTTVLCSCRIFKEFDVAQLRSARQADNPIKSWLIIKGK